MTKSVLRELMAHRGPMLLLDKFVQADESEAMAEIHISPESSFYVEPHGVPSWIGLEYMAQSIAVFAGAKASRLGVPTPIGYLLGTRRFECPVQWFENGLILTSTCREEVVSENGLAVYTCWLRGEGIECSSRLTVYLTPDEARDEKIKGNV